MAVFKQIPTGNLVCVHAFQETPRVFMCLRAPFAPGAAVR